MKEDLIEIVNALDSYAKARSGSGIVPVARVHCLDNGAGKTYWFTNRLHHPRELSSLYKFGNFVPRYSDLAIKFRVINIPCFILFKDGSAIATKVGGSTKSALKDWIVENTKK